MSQRDAALEALNEIDTPFRRTSESYAEKMDTIRQALERQRAPDSIVRDLAEWSEQYPRGRIYPMSQKSMDDELIAIEDRAKEWLAAAPEPNDG